MNTSESRRTRRRLRIQAGLEALWYGDSAVSLLLAPFGIVYGWVMRTRRQLYNCRILPATAVGCPVIVVGNLTIGGTGKTPLVIAIATWLKAAGLRPGIVCRGYQGAASTWPQAVYPHSDPSLVGDEAVLLADQTQCAVVADPDRIAAARRLIETCGCDVIISDDGLQHLRLQRDLEIVVVDAMRGLGNGRCLPAGPLREPGSRLRSVGLIVTNGLSDAVGLDDPDDMRMVLQPLAAVSVRDPSQRVALSDFSDKRIHAVCGIGNPPRFFTALRALGLSIIEHPFPDHHPFVAADLRFSDDCPVLMTAKDAVKCRSFADSRQWSVAVAVEVNPMVKAYLFSVLGIRG